MGDFWYLKRHKERVVAAVSKGPKGPQWEVRVRRGLRYMVVSHRVGVLAGVQACASETNHLAGGHWESAGPGPSLARFTALNRERIVPEIMQTL